MSLCCMHSLLSCAASSLHTMCWTPLPWEIITMLPNILWYYAMFDKYIGGEKSVKFNTAELWLILFKSFWIFLYDFFHHSKPTTVFSKESNWLKKGSRAYMYIFSTEILWKFRHFWKLLHLDKNLRTCDYHLNLNFDY